MPEVEQSIATVNQGHVVVPHDKAVEGCKHLDRVGVVGVSDATKQLSFGDCLTALAFKRKKSACLRAQPGGLVEVPRGAVPSAAVLETPRFGWFLAEHAQGRE